MTRTLRKALLVLALAASTFGVISAATPAPAEAAGGCWNRGPDRSRWIGNGIPFEERYTTWYCHAYQGGDVMDGGRQGHLYAGTSWFVCQRRFPGHENPAVGSARNDWWVFTLADTSTGWTGGWGWFPATKISGGGNYARIPGNLPTCNTGPGNHVSAGTPYGP